MGILILIVILFFNSILEFLPISSTLHIIFIFNLLKLQDVETFLAFSQLGITLSLCIFYRKIILDVILKFFFDKKTRIFCYKIFFLCVISCLCGFVFLQIIKNIKYNHNTSALALMSLGVVMIFIEKFTVNTPNDDDIHNTTWKQNMYIGFMQALSLAPGVSRSGSTVCGGLFGGLNKKTAIKYSFFVSIPINIVASFYDIYKNYDLIIRKQNIPNITIIFMLSFIFSLFFIKNVLEFFNKTNLKFFGYYRILIGLITFLG
jgi:undecaprenyl-diphosphatase